VAVGVLVGVLVLEVRSSGDGVEDPPSVDRPDEVADPVQVVSGAVTRVEVGDRLELRLSAEPGLGDAWQVAVPPDEDVVRVIDVTSESDEPDVAGGLWTDVVVMEAVGPGTTMIGMHNCFRCDDEGNTPPDYAEEAVDLAYTISVG
jgi:hypothetical protein